MSTQVHRELWRQSTISCALHIVNIERLSSWLSVNCGVPLHGDSCVAFVFFLPETHFFDMTCVFTEAAYCADELAPGLFTLTSIAVARFLL